MAVMNAHVVDVRFPVERAAFSGVSFEPLLSLRTVTQYLTGSAFWREQARRTATPGSMLTPLAIVDDQRPLRRMRAVRLVESDDDTI